MFGYTVGKDGYYVRETEHGEADAVLQIFELYSTGQYGEYKLYKELEARGVVSKTNLKGGNIARILKTEEYTGEKIPERTITEKETGEKKVMFHERQYPAIITRKMFEIAKQVRQVNTTNIDKAKNTYLAAKLCKCSDCGSTMVANKNNAVYRCDNKYHVTREKKCQCGDTISIDCVDSIAWGIACELEVDYILNFTNEQLEIWENEIKILHLKIDNSDRQYEGIKARKIKRYLEDIPDATPEEQQEHAIRATRQDRQRIEQEKAGYQTEINRLKGLIAEASTRFPNGAYREDIILDDLLRSDDRQRYDVVHKYIKEIIILPEPDIKGTKRIVVKFLEQKVKYGNFFRNGQMADVIFFYNGRVKDRTRRLYQRVDTGIAYCRYIGMECGEINRDLTREEIAKIYADRQIIDLDDLSGCRGVGNRFYYDYSTRFERKKKQ
jgi:hypothetical protein